MSDNLADGLDELRKHLDLKTIMSLIESTARWVDPATFKLLPIWYPEYARRAQLYNANWTVARMLKASTLKFEGNTQANKALTQALGLRSRSNWTCCHIWGVDDPTYQRSNDVVQDHRFFSCVANMVLLPMPLKAFTDAMPDVKAMLRICARNTYGWHCDHESVAEAVDLIDRWNEWDAYPQSWPRAPGKGAPKGVRPLNAKIKANSKRRLQAIGHDLVHAGPYYPREAVRASLEYWGVAV
ncbi:MAG: hypothetical protein ABL871_12410 [Terricaulis sp.]